MNNLSVETLHPVAYYSAMLDTALENDLHPLVKPPFQRAWRVVIRRKRPSAFPLDELLADPDKSARLVEEFEADLANPTLFSTSDRRRQLLTAHFGLADGQPVTSLELAKPGNITVKAINAQLKVGLNDLYYYLRKKTGIAPDDFPDLNRTQARISNTLGAYLREY
jgi:hypothetical protein